MATTTATHPDRLHFTGNEAADALIAREPFALLVGFALDQQVPVQTAFSGPLKIKQRLGTLDPRKLSSMDPAELDAAFREKPAVHRFPGTMAQRVQDLAAFVAAEYGGKPERIWTDARDGRDLDARLRNLPGFGDMKVRSMLAVLAKRFGVRPPGMDEVVPKHPTLGDVDSAEALAEYQEKKRAHKAEMRAKRQA
jgi:uncharacterized HhH-GPD family protein